MNFRKLSAYSPDQNSGALSVVRLSNVRAAKREFHPNWSDQDSQSERALQAPHKKSIKTSALHRRYESNMAASSSPAKIEPELQETCCQATQQEREKMRKMLLSMALAVVAPFAWGQVSETSTTTTTTTEGNGTITEYTPGSAIVLRESSGPRRYRFGKTVSYVTRSGRVLDEDTVRTRVKVGVPVRVHYMGTGDNMMVDRVILDED